MAIVTIFSGIYSHGEEVAAATANRFGLRRVEDELLEKVSNQLKIKPEKLKKAMLVNQPTFTKLPREQKRQLAYLRRALAEIILEDNLLLHGFASHLISMDIPHILRICIIANLDYRIALAGKSEGKSEKSAAKFIRKEDEHCIEWVQLLRNASPWDEELYDLVIPMHGTTVEEAVNIISENLGKEALKTNEYALKAVKDNLLAAEINLVLVEKGHDIDVVVRDGEVTLLINTYTLRLEQYEEELESIVLKIAGVKNVNAKVGPRYTAPSINPMSNFELPPRMLLVDDEKDFVHTLSERLQTRDLETAVVYDGEQALSYVNSDDPEVIVLDLKMPGIDGLEVLQRVKKSHPHVEVIILTGHGDEKEKKIAFELGAFAYLQKPANIDQLAETMKAAYRKVRDNKRKKSAGDDNIPGNG